MTLSLRRWIVSAGLVGIVTAISSPTSAEVLGVKGSATALVVQLNGADPVQTDFSQEIVPQTRPEPPVVASARLDRLLSDGSVTAAGQALAVFDRPAVLPQGTSNYAGLDLGAFSDDEVTQWLVDGAVTTVRSLQLSASDIDSQLGLDGVARVRSRVLLSGVMLITASDPGRDLTGAMVHLSFNVTLRQNGRPTSTPLDGQVDLVGGPNGTAQVENATGALSSVLLPIADFTGQIPELPVAQALPFVGINLPYNYEIVVGRPFELELAVAAEVLTLPNGVGAAAVFGTPQEGLASVLTRVKGDDRGRELAAAVSQHVDTTGAAYADTPIDALPPSAAVIPMCGMMNVGAFGLLLAFGLARVVYRGGVAGVPMRRLATHPGG